MAVWSTEVMLWHKTFSWSGSHFSPVLCHGSPMVLAEDTNKDLKVGAKQTADFLLDLLVFNLLYETPFIPYWVKSFNCHHLVNDEPNSWWILAGHSCIVFRELSELPVITHIPITLWQGHLNSHLFVAGNTHWFVVGVSFLHKAQDLSVIEEVIRMMLEIINSCLTNSLHHNPNLVYALLYKRDLFEQFRTHPSFQDIMQNIDLVRIHGGICLYCLYYTFLMSGPPSSPGCPQTHDPLAPILRSTGIYRHGHLTHHDAFLSSKGDKDHFSKLVRMIDQQWIPSEVNCIYTLP